MEARLLSIESQLQSLVKVQTILVSVLGSATSFSLPAGYDFKNLLSDWDGRASQVQSSVTEAQEKIWAEEKVPEATIEPIHDSGIATPVEETATEELEKLASDILDIIQRYGKHTAPKDGEEHSAGWIGKPMFVEKVLKQLQEGRAIRMILPAFPWKSINKVDKVTGVLPDLGEELALARLNQMCEDIRAVYPLGGEVHIATDGMVFDDVVGIPDEDTWAYSEGLMDIVRQRGYDRHIKLMRVMDILGHTAGRKLDKALYLSLTQQCREELLAGYGRTEEEVREMMREDSDTLLTYCGFVRFLESDLRHSEVAKTATSGQKFRKCVKKVAINMMIRAESFTKLLQAKCPDYVRLSIHPSTGAVKLSVPLIVTRTGDFPRTPWHSSLAVARDGSYSTVHSKDVRDTHSLVARDDASARPYYFREKSDLWDWEDADVVFEPLYPNRLVVRPSRRCEGVEKSLTDEQLEKLRELRAVHTAGPVEVIGFANAAAATAAAAPAAAAAP
ncbi:Pyoverdine/dityrosine biosynthesis protein-domain-containing protein [Macrophomina phaseolina]|uniref:Pyoverdine/dityrosine biosynthesis protein-domain-containing protein n=1 Tax=Macrophomina phaseolina TaxID=35725 RepID=A0ABQ8GCS0_9PEZI|nr:Pyoverdine/dityrosine biosynthesis protein-domain-containing protein [Macrophomina phaseolina]